MMRARFSKEDIPNLAKLGAVFVGVGVVYGALSGDGTIIGAFAGMLLFGFMMGIGLLAEFIGLDSE